MIEMKLNPIPFESMLLGKKTVEIRLNDEKRQQLKTGDEIIFHEVNSEEDCIKVVIEELRPFKTFKDMVENCTMAEFGYPESTHKEDFIESIFTIYSKEQEKEFGVLAIKVRLI